MNIVYTHEVTSGPPTVLENLFDIAGGRPADMYFCPLSEGPWRPQLSVSYDGCIPTDYTDDFYFQGAACRHWVEYNMFFLIYEEGVMSWNWDNSGNPDIDGDNRPDGPYEWGNSEAAVMADANTTWTAGQWDTPAYSNHTGNIQGAGFRDGNILYGDGHALLRSTLLEHVSRSQTGLYSY